MAKRFLFLKMGSFSVRRDKSPSSFMLRVTLQDWSLDVPESTTRIPSFACDGSADPSNTKTSLCRRGLEVNRKVFC